VNKLIVVFTAVVIGAIVTSLYFVDPFAVAKPQSKFHFTKTLTSLHDPGVGQSGQFALLLSPNQGSLYDGSLTFAATTPIEIVVLHEISKEDVKGQPTWSVDGNTIYGMSVMEPAKSGSFEFTGAALAFRSRDSFSVTASVDGWIRGQPTEIAVQKIAPQERSFFLPDSHVPVTIPMRLGFFESDSVYYIVTDSSNQTLADRASKDWRIEFAPKLRWMPASSQDSIYVFTNGEKGDGMYGYQGDVFASIPAKSDDYSPLRSVIMVSWKAGQNPQVLDSEDEILKAEKDSRIKLVRTNVTINAPQMAWPGGQLSVSNNTISNEFGKSQVLSIDKDSKKVEFVAHRGWGGDGRTIYYIITDATPKGPSDLMGVPTSPKLANALSSNIVSDMYQFKNGIKGSGQLGFQPSILSSTNQNYVPICRVLIVEWKNPADALILENVGDIDKKKSDRDIDVTLARPLSEDHVVNCPIIESTDFNKR
jgi:hypothetical protein